jgi:hypothetical protein
VKTTLAPKFGGPAQRWAGLAWEEVGQDQIMGVGPCIDFEGGGVLYEEIRSACGGGVPHEV